MDSVSDRPDQASNQSNLVSKITTGYQFGWFDWFCLRYPPGWLILFNRHWQHYHADPDGWNRLEYLLFLVPLGFYLALMLRWLRLGCRSPRAIHETIDPDYQRAFQQEVLTPILRHHFRAELHQLENLPKTDRLIVAMNHAGMCFPWDIVGLGVLLNQTQGWLAQPLAHEIFFDHPWLHWWLPVGWLQVLGGVRAEPTHFEAAIASQTDNTVVLYAPEGWRGLAKGWRNRYRLKTFDPSFVQLSDRYQVPILPVVCMGNEYLHPWTININRVARWVGLPMFPLSLLLLVFVLFPSMGVWASPTRLRYFIQPVLPSSDWQRSRSVAYRKAQTLRSHLQAQIDQLRT